MKKLNNRGVGFGVMIGFLVLIIIAVVIIIMQAQDHGYGVIEMINRSFLRNFR